MFAGIRFVKYVRNMTKEQFVNLQSSQNNNASLKKATKKKASYGMIRGRVPLRNRLG